MRHPSKIKKIKVEMNIDYLYFLYKWKQFKIKLTRRCSKI